ncbi:transposase [Streptomyces sp. NPDC058964]|uniref:transposase n=1 Tax=Streptomyces sp. NPDC058964 TaxID=3346681 RepID=UPI0036A66F1B
MYAILYVDAIRIEVRDGGTVVNKVVHLVIGVEVDAIKNVLGIWVEGDEGRSSGCACSPAQAPRPEGRADRVLRRAHGPARGHRGGLAVRDHLDLVSSHSLVAGCSHRSPHRRGRAHVDVPPSRSSCGPVPPGRRRAVYWPVGVVLRAP